MLTFLVKKKTKKKPWGCLFFVNTRKNFKSNIVLVVVLCLISKGLYSIQCDLQTPKKSLNTSSHLVFLFQKRFSGQEGNVSLSPNSPLPKIRSRKTGATWAKNSWNWIDDVNETQFFCHFFLSSVWNTLKFGADTVRLSKELKENRPRVGLNHQPFGVVNQLTAERANRLRHGDCLYIQR